MKKIQGLVVLIIAVVLLTACDNDILVRFMETAPTEETTVPIEFEFEAVESDSLYFRIKEYLGNDETVVLPTEYKDLEILSIGDAAFFKSTIKTVVIPDGLMEIGDYAFSHSDLETIQLPGTVETIGRQCFEGTKIRQIKIPARVKTLPYGLFRNCSDLESIVLSSRVQECSLAVFDGCSSLKNIHFEGVISEREVRRIFTSFDRLPENCVVTALDSEGNTVELYNGKKTSASQFAKMSSEEIETQIFSVPYDIYYWFTARQFAGTTSEQEMVVVDGKPYYKILDGAHTKYDDLICYAEKYFSKELVGAFVAEGAVLNRNGELYQFGGEYGGPFVSEYPVAFSVESYTDEKVVFCRCHKYPKDPWTDKTIAQMTNEDYNTFYTYYVMELIDGQWLFTQWEQDM